MKKIFKITILLYFLINALNFSLSNKKHLVQALCYGKKISWLMPSLAEHWIHNSLSILGLAVYFKIDFTESLPWPSLLPP